MKRIYYKFISVAAVAMMLISCGDGGEVHMIPTGSVKLSGAHSKYIAVEGENAKLKFIASKKRNEVVPSIDVTFVLDEEPGKLDDYKMGFDRINLSLCDKDGKPTKLGLLHTVPKNAVKFEKLLGGNAGETTTVTFIAEDGCSQDSVASVVATIASFKVDNIELSRSEAYWDKRLDAMKRALDAVAPLARELKYDSGNMNLMFQCAEYGQVLDALNNELMKADENKELSGEQQKRYEDIVASVADLM